MSAPLEAFRDACGREHGEAIGADRLAALLRRAAAELPALRVDPVELARALGRLVADGLALDGVDVVELAVAVACAAKDDAAADELDRRWVQPVATQLAHLRLDAAMLAEVLQTTRRRLLVAPEGASPRVLGYAGRGQLAALVRVVATRAALDARRDDARKREVDISGLGQVLLASTDPERIAASARKREVFRAAFEAAIAALPASDRTLMRLYAVDGVGIDGLALAYGVHRSTAARRLAAVRERIRLGTRAQLEGRGVAGDELESVIAIVDEGLELTLSRILADPLAATHASDAPHG